MSFRVTLKTVFQFWAQLDCPTSLRLKLLAEAGDWAGVLATSVEPEQFEDPIQYSRANAAVCILKKFPDLPGFDDEYRKAQALKTWKDGELLCYHANERLNVYLASPLSGDAPSEFLRRVRRRLISWLGHHPSDDELKLRARHGPGTTFSSSVANPTAADKYSDKMSVTSGAVIHVLNLAGTKWMDLSVHRSSKTSDELFEVVRGNRHAFAPKTASTFRNIAIEPSVNMYFQLAVGSAMRARMRKHAGWDLDNASDIHRKMAQSGSIDGSFATIDLSNASDTLSKTLVRVLLRETGWLPLLEDLRSTHTRIEQSWHLLEKFSSMGNGYTFELESCVFAAIVAECLVLKGHQPEFGKNLGIFGDDIIIPSDSYGLVVDVLQWCGFVINKKKSYSTSPFRESCGGDFFYGHPVRGYYLREALSRNNHQRTYAMINGLRALESRCQISFDSVVDELLKFLPTHLRSLGGSSRLGDTVLHGQTSVHRWKNGIRWVRAVRWSKPILIKWAHFSEEARLACRLTGYGDTFGINTRGARVCSELVWVSDS